MPSTRKAPLQFDGSELPSDDEDDPDYRESSADDDDDDDLPKTLARDRAQWTVDYHEDISELYQSFKEVGGLLFGRAFFQTGDITKFAHFCYKYTQPGAAPVFD